MNDGEQIRQIVNDQHGVRLASEVKFVETEMHPLQLCWMWKAAGQKDVKVLMWRQVLHNMGDGTSYTEWQEIPTSGIRFGEHTI